MAADESQNIQLDFVVEADASEQRLDIYLAALIEDVSRTRLQALIKKKLVLLNGRECKANIR